MTRYKVKARSCEGWRDFGICTLGVSVGAKNWEGKKFEAILGFAADNFDKIRLDITDAIYQHNFMAQGLDALEARTRANAEGTYWLARHAQIISSCKVKPEILRWETWYGHPDFNYILNAVRSAYQDNSEFKDLVDTDVSIYMGRHTNHSPKARAHSLDFILEEIAVFIIQARELPSVRIYPGAGFEVFRRLRESPLDGVPTGMERDKFMRVKFESRDAAPVAANMDSLKQNNTQFFKIERVSDKATNQPIICFDLPIPSLGQFAEIRHKEARHR